MKTTALKKSKVIKNWYVIDCTDKIIGRVSSEVSKILQGKNKPDYAPNLNNGDQVILINTSKIKWTGNNKGKAKLYRKHSGYQGGLTERNLEWMMNKNPNAVIYNSVSRMLPKNKMREVYMGNLYMYVNEEHKHQAQNPVKLDI